MAARLKRPPTVNALSKVVGQPGLDLSTATLDHFRNVGINDADCIKVSAIIIYGDKEDKRSGITSRTFDPSSGMDGQCFFWLKISTY